MKHLLVYLMALISTTATFAQVRTFTSNGQTFTVDIAATISDYYNESQNGSWCCIPDILEYAAEKEHLSKAQYLYGMSYMQGIDRDIDIDKGMMWLKKAADQGEKEAASELGAYYEEFGQHADAERYLLKACSLGANLAYFNLGNHYMALDNMELAEKYYKLAIEHGPKGQLQSIHNLVILFARQMRVTDVVALLRKGAENYNDPYSQARLGELLYYNGSDYDNKPSHKDKTEGKRWLEKAAANGDNHAKNVLFDIK